MTNRSSEALNGLPGPDELDDHEQEFFFDRFADKMRTASREEQDFWAERRRRGLGVGIDDQGDLIYPAVLMPPSAQTLH